MEQEAHLATHTDVVFYLDVDLLVTAHVRAFEVTSMPKSDEETLNVGVFLSLLVLMRL